MNKPKKKQYYALFDDNHGEFVNTNHDLWLDKDVAPILTKTKKEALKLLAKDRKSGCGNDYTCVVPVIVTRLDIVE